MSLIKAAPIVALGIAGAVGFNAFKDNANIIERFQVAATQNVEMQSIADAVVLYYMESNRLPTGNFRAFLQEWTRRKSGKSGGSEGTERDRSLDSWGTPYQLEGVGKGFEIRSAGPDKAWATQDDLALFYSLQGVVENPPDFGPGRPPRANPGAPSAPAQTAKRTPGGPTRARRTQSEAETDRKVVQFLMRQAAKGSATSQYELGRRYLEGDGVEMDGAAALSWLEKSAEMGYSPAIQKLEEIHALATFKDP